MSTENSSRREFLRLAAAAVSTAAIGEHVIAQTTSASATGVPTRLLGRTGVRVSMLGVGGSHAGRIPVAEGTRFMHMAVDEGVTFFDNAWDYGGGTAEEIMGRNLAIDGYRKKVFLMTKNCGRDYKDSMQCLEDSLRRLRTDHLDLWQFHEINYDSDPDWVLERGALKAAIEARKAGKVRFIGFTGHKHPSIHLNMLGKNFEWDTSQMPNNVADSHFRSFQKRTAARLLASRLRPSKWPHAREQRKIDDAASARTRAARPDDRAWRSLCAALARTAGKFGPIRASAGHAPPWR